MARPLRIQYPGACYHVINRGDNRRPIFDIEADYQLFLDKLAEFAIVFGIEIRSYCLMLNHFHLYLCTPEANLSKFMHSLATSYTTIKNRAEQTSGHLFQGRYKAILKKAWGHTYDFEI